jgi:hypothetical protein
MLIVSVSLTGNLIKSDSHYITTGEVSNVMETQSFQIGFPSR